MRFLIMLFLSTISVASSATGAVQSKSIQIRPTQDISIYVVSDGLFSDGRPKALVRIWPDGRIIWSRNGVSGGEPFFEGRANPQKMEEFFHLLQSEQVYSKKNLSRSYYGPDSSFTVIRINDGNLHLKMESWHELSEAGGGGVATSGGITTLGNRKLEDVLKVQPKPYREFRAYWKKIRTLANGLIPSNGKAVFGYFDSEAGSISWHQNTKGKTNSKDHTGRPKHPRLPNETGGSKLTSPFGSSLVALLTSTETDLKASPDLRTYKLDAMAKRKLNGKHQKTHVQVRENISR